MEWLINILIKVVAWLLFIGFIIFVGQLIMLLWKTMQGRIQFFNIAFPWLGAYEVKPVKKEKPSKASEQHADIKPSKPRFNRHIKLPHWLVFICTETPASYMAKRRQRKEQDSKTAPLDKWRFNSDN